MHVRVRVHATCRSCHLDSALPHHLGVCHLRRHGIHLLRCGLLLRRLCHPHLLLLLLCEQGVCGTVSRRQLLLLLLLL